MTTPDETRNTPSMPIVDPFPKPNTIPSGWDVSAFKTGERAASEERPLDKPKPEERNRDLK